MAVNPSNPANTSEVFIPEGGSVTFKDFRGFTVFQIMEKGDFKHKGKAVKLP